MLDSETKRNINNLRDTLVGIIPDPKAQIDQITFALMYKFMHDLDEKSKSLGGSAEFFSGEYEQYSWEKLFDTKLTGFDKLKLYNDAIESFSLNENAPEIFQKIYYQAYVPFNNPRILNLFLTEINKLNYDNSEIIGTAFEYLLSFMSSQGDAGQFRTPRHIIDFMVQIVNPQKNETILDPACGTAGFLISSYKHILHNNQKNIPGDKLNFEQKQNLYDNLVGYDIAPDMVRLSLVNMYLHQFNDPKIYEYDTLSSEVRWNDYFDVILANPPFFSPKGGIKPHSRFAMNTTRAEVLFVEYIIQHLKPNGRAAIIVPEGIISRNNNAYKNLRKLLIDTSLIGVISLPAGVFQPYSGVRTSILILNKKLSQKTESIFFAKIEYDGYSLGAQRTPISKNDLPFILSYIKKSNESNEKFQYIRKQQLLENDTFSLNTNRYKEEIINSKFNLIEITKLFDLIRPPKKIKKSNFLETGNFPIVDQSVNFIAGYWNKHDDCVKVDKPLIIFGDHTRIIKFIEFDFVAGADGLKIMSPNEKVLPKFFYYITKHMKLPNLGYSRHYSEFKRKKVPLPPIAIQQQIVDELEGYQKIIDGCIQVVENYKPTIDIDPSWKMIKLCDIGVIISGGTPKTSEKSYWGGNIKWLTLVDLPADENISYVNNSKRKITELGLSKSSAKIIPPKSVIVSTRATIGRIAINEIEVSTNQGFKSIIIDQAKYVSEYIALQIFLKRKYLNQIATGATFKEINVNNFKKLEIPIPPMNIQKEIVKKFQQEREIIMGNKKLINTYNQNIQNIIGRIWND